MTDALTCNISTTPLHAAPGPDKTRRIFLMLGAGAAGATAAGPLLAAPAALVEPEQAKPRAQGYRETAHVRNYYTTTRI